MHPTAPKGQWFDDAKFGLFIHYGLYSQLGGEYQQKIIPGLAEWIQNHAKIPFDTYKKLADTFNPSAFDADTIARNAKAWGMRYICLTAKHHEGFALFDSKVSDYNSVTACGRDLVRELSDACQTHGLTLCLYYSQAQDWAHPDGYMAYASNEGKNFRRYLDEKCIPELTQILTDYGPLGAIWFDTPMDMTPQESEELAAIVRKHQPNCLISGRIGHKIGDYITTQDNRIPAYPITRRWEVPATTNDSWGYKRSDTNWASAEDIVTDLIHIVSRGGNYLLNVGPMGDGTIPDACTQILGRIGAWMSTAGESILQTTATPLYVYEAPELAFTHKPHTLYIHILNPQKMKQQHVGIPHIANTVVDAQWLNHEGEVDFEAMHTLEGNPYWAFTVPDTASQMPLTLKVTTAEAEYLQEEL